MSILEKQTHDDLETWRKLLAKAITAIEIVERETGIKQSIRLGGGTVLSALWGHRYSQDVDLFTRDPQIIAYLRPSLNDNIAAVLGTDYVDGGNDIGAHQLRVEHDSSGSRHTHCVQPRAKAWHTGRATCAGSPVWMQPLLRDAGGLPD